MKSKDSFIGTSVRFIYSLPRLRNHNATDDGNVDLRFFRKNFTFEAWKIHVK